MHSVCNGCVCSSLHFTCKTASGKEISSVVRVARVYYGVSQFYWLRNHMIEQCRTMLEMPMTCMISIRQFVSPHSICFRLSSVHLENARVFFVPSILEHISSTRYCAVLVLYVICRCGNRCSQTIIIFPFRPTEFAKSLIHHNSPFSLLNYRLKLECEKLTNEKTEMQRHYVMVSKQH